MATQRQIAEARDTLLGILILAVLGLGYWLLAPRIAAWRAGRTASAPTEITVDASTMMRDYQSNAAAADAFYKGKTVAVSGPIDRIEADGTIHLGAGLGVACHGAKPASVTELRAGQWVVVKGRCSGMGFMAPRVDQCSVVGK